MLGRAIMTLNDCKRQKHYPAARTTSQGLPPRFWQGKPCAECMAFSALSVCTHTMCFSVLLILLQRHLYWNLLVSLWSFSRHASSSTCALFLCNVTHCALSLGALTESCCRRLSYQLRLTGPCLVVDTACSASLVAVSLARSHLVGDTCSSAVVAGENLLLDPTTTVLYCQTRMLSANGKCKTFDDKADGYVSLEYSTQCLVTVCLDRCARKAALLLACKHPTITQLVSH